MRLSTVVLSATALLSQAASGFYLLSSTHANLSAYGYAKVSFESGVPGQAVGGFTALSSSPYMTINMDADGDIGSGWLLRPDPNVSGIWKLLSRASASVMPDDITRPFAVTSDNQFVYKGADGWVWNVCIENRSRQPEHLYLSTKPMQAVALLGIPTYCYGNVPLVATELKGVGGIVVKDA